MRVNEQDFLKRSQEVLERGFLPLNEEYAPLPHTDQEEVEICPKKYIITELLEVCYILWSKNIFTYMTSDYRDDSVWIAIKLTDLSSENIAYIDSLGKKVKKFAREDGCIHIGVNKKGEEARLRLMQIACGFTMQDVPKWTTIDYESAMINCGCFKKEANPEYLTLEEYQQKFGPLVYGEYRQYLDSIYGTKYFKKLDPSKIKGKEERILQKHNYALDGDNTIYKSPFYLKKHTRYVEYKNTLKEIQKLTKRK